MNGITSLSGNKNTTGFVSPVLGAGAACCDTYIKLYQEEHNVPEPATLLLMGLGLAGIGWKRRKAA